jgi:hypothetical protein
MLTFSVCLQIKMPARSVPIWAVQSLLLGEFAVGRICTQAVSQDEKSRESGVRMDEAATR